MKSLFRFQWLGVALCAVLSMSALTATAEMRTWTSSGGSYRLKAEFAGASGEKITLRDEAGKEYVLQLSALSSADQAYVRSRLKPAAPVAGTPSGTVLAAAAKKVERMEPVLISDIVENPEMEFPVAGFTGSITQLVHAPKSVGGITPQSGFTFAVAGIRLTPDKLPAATDVCGFYIESPRGNRYPVHLLVVESADDAQVKRTLRDVRTMVFSAKEAGDVIENTYVFMIPLIAKFKDFRLGFTELEKAAATE